MPIRNLVRDFLEDHVVTEKGKWLPTETRFRLEMRKKFITVRIVRHWNRVSREIVDVQCLALFKVRLNGALSNQVW